MIQYFKLFANCLLVKGAKRALICDIQRNEMKLISLDLYEILIVLNKKTCLEDVFAIYGKANRKIIDDFLQFLTINEYGFLCDAEEFELFQLLNLKFESPNQITNAVVEINLVERDFFLKIQKQLEKINCDALNIITYSPLTFENFKIINEVFQGSKIKIIEILTAYSINHDNSFFQKLKLLNSRLIKLVIYNSPKEEVIDYDKYLFPIIFTKTNISNFKSCGKISSDYFSTNKNKYLESLNFNSCLNKKISIDINGFVKNCPSMNESFGNIKNVSLEDALNHKNFKRFWSISKDKINICKDCEFRYVCTDCRAYLEVPEDIYSKPLKCGYDPFTNTWSDWSINPLKQSAIEFYGMQELMKKG